MAAATQQQKIRWRASTASRVSGKRHHLCTMKNSTRFDPDVRIACAVLLRCIADLRGMGELRAAAQEAGQPVDELDEQAREVVGWLMDPTNWAAILAGIEDGTRRRFLVDLPAEWRAGHEDPEDL